MSRLPKTRSGARKPKTQKPWLGEQYRRDIAKIAARALETPAERVQRAARKKAYRDGLWRPEQTLWRIEFLLDIAKAKMQVEDRLRELRELQRRTGENRDGDAAIQLSRARLVRRR